MDSTMQDYPLTIGSIMRYACDVHGDRNVTTATGDGYRQTNYREVGEQGPRWRMRCAASVSPVTSGSRRSCGTTPST